MNLTSRFSLRSIPFTRELSVEDRFVLAHFEQELQFLKEIVENRMSAALIAPVVLEKRYFCAPSKNHFLRPGLKCITSR